MSAAIHAEPFPATRTLADLITERLDPEAVSAEQWPKLADTALQQGVAPLLAWTLKQRAAPDISESLERALLRSLRRAAVQEECQRAINDWLRAANIPALWLKGAALARTVYPDPALRPMGDLDVLVPHDRCREALDILLLEGYPFAALDRFAGSGSIDEPAAKSNHHYELIGGPSNDVAVELHFRLLAQNNLLLPLDRLAWFFEQSVEVRLDDGPPYRVPSPEAHLLYLAAHAVLQHGETPPTLLQLYDMDRLMARHAIDWDVVIDRAVALGWTRALQMMLSQTADHFHSDIPVRALEELRRRRPDSEAKPVVRGEGARWDRARGTLATLSPTGKVRYVFQSLFPAPAYLRRKYDVTGRHALWRLYMKRWRILARDMRAARRKRLPATNEESVSVYDGDRARALIEAQLSDGYPVVFRPGGQSMRPTIRDGDLVGVTPAVGAELLPGMILLYRRGESTVLHRLIRFDAEGRCSTVADAAVQEMSHVPREDILGVATWVKRADRTVRLDSRRARLAGLWWFRLRPVRRGISHSR